MSLRSSQAVMLAVRSKLLLGFCLPASQRLELVDTMWFSTFVSKLLLAACSQILFGWWVMRSNFMGTSHHAMKRPHALFWLRGYSTFLIVWKLLLLLFLFFWHLWYTSSFGQQVALRLSRFYVKLCEFTVLCEFTLLCEIMWIHGFMWIHTFMWSYENSQFCAKWCDFTRYFLYLFIKPKSRGHALSIFSLVSTSWSKPEEKTRTWKPMIFVFSIFIFDFRWPVCLFW